MLICNTSHSKHAAGCLPPTSGSREQQTFSKSLARELPPRVLRCPSSLLIASSACVAYMWHCQFKSGTGCCNIYEWLSPLPVITRVVTCDPPLVIKEDAGIYWRFPIHILKHHRLLPVRMNKSFPTATSMVCDLKLVFVFPFLFNLQSDSFRNFQYTKNTIYTTKDVIVLKL